MSEASSNSRRRYDSSTRRAQAAQTRERIIAAAVELVHDFASWNWEELTFRAVAARAGVGERTVYRHFPTERHLHDAVMARLEEHAGITYEDVTLDNLAEVTARVFGSLQRFSVGESVNTPQDPTFADVDRRRRDALRCAVADAAPQWTEPQQRATAGLLDVLWNLPTYERLVGTWNLPEEDATQAVGWLLNKVAALITSDDPPLGIA
ncbi:MAG: helix-turn-helix domain-containing protein [Mycobacterium sp.]